MITISAHEADEIVRIQPAASVVVVENPFCGREPDALDVPTSGLKPSGRRRKVWLVGRLSNKQKNLQGFIKFCDYAPGNFSINLVGDDTLEVLSERTERKIETFGWVASPVSLVHDGPIVIPSLYEGVPLVLLEAYTHNVPVLVSDIPELSQFVVRECVFDFDDLSKANCERFTEIVQKIGSGSFISRDEWATDYLRQYGFRNAHEWVSRMEAEIFRLRY
ncbi:glycosyltransferase [Sulfitobacter sp. 1A16808]|uniref:glycosyltransferase n=1 Tax=Sulfitobacter sp. 1A16808 TaxID=3368572 RepID=UPI003744FADE